MNRNRRWEHFEHGADIGVRGFGSTPAEAFEQAAQALTAVVIDEPRGLRGIENVDVRCDAPDLDTLLFNWLNALIFEMATRRMLFADFTVEIHNSHLHARLVGEPFDANRHAFSVEVKGATYTALAVRPIGGEWLAQCVVDV